MTDRSYVICSAERNEGNSRIHRLQKRWISQTDEKNTDPVLRENSLFSCGDGSFLAVMKALFQEVYLKKRLR